ncbi:MAG: ComEA family DNA-binding protein [Firmicutes bacterium]|nr:ComEA family DNA-binding protein [Bacillota bacterium]
MDKLKGIRSIEDLKEFIYLYKDVIKKVAMPVIVVAAVLIFWIVGLNKDETIVEEIDNGKNISEEKNLDSELKNEEKIKIYADISGCVEKPGVYEVEEGTRIFQLIEKAGGLTKDADIEGLNRAEIVSDGQKIIIYAKGESQESENTGVSSSGKININTADASQLQTISGVGPVTAEKIIEYRKANGKFSSIEDIKNVSGIGDKTFEKIRENITIR